MSLFLHLDDTRYVPVMAFTSDIDMHNFLTKISSPAITAKYTNTGIECKLRKSEIRAEIKSESQRKKISQVTIKSIIKTP